MFSILHISDLHRSKREPISNDELVSALVSDRARYTQEDPPVRDPDAIVVSGDIIQGVPLGTADSEAQILEQYDIAEKFLAELADRFVAGDRTRVVVVPGNHDVDWNTARRAMTAVADVPHDVAKLLFTETSLHRWDWKTQTLYQITDRELYAKRLDAFCGFHERFYSDAKELLRVTRGSDANLFRLNDGKIGVAAFNSCHGNDCFAFHGSIPREVVARTHLDLAAGSLSFDLRLAVWHHSIEGPPYRTDYMDVDIVRSMVGRGFRLGLYGHQHKAQAEPQHVYLPDRETMAVVSAGSLCAGPEELPPGVHRQYNVVEIADDFRSARVHVRQMTAGNLFGRAFLTSFGGASSVLLQWDPPKDLGGRPTNASLLRVRAQTEEAEALYKRGDYARCVSLLFAQHGELDVYGRRLLIDAALQASDWPSLRIVANPPRSVSELVARVTADFRQRDFTGAIGTLDQFGPALKLDPATDRELRERVKTEEAMPR